MTQWSSSVALLACVVLGGCAAGRTNSGGVVVGFDVASLPETAKQAANLAAGLLPDPWGTIATAGIALLGGGGLLGYAKKRGEDKGWDDREAHQGQIDSTYDLAKAEAKK